MSTYDIPNQRIEFRNDVSLDNTIVANTFEQIRRVSRPIREIIANEGVGIVFAFGDLYTQPELKDRKESKARSRYS